MRAEFSGGGGGGGGLPGVINGGGDASGGHGDAGDGGSGTGGDGGGADVHGGFITFIGSSASDPGDASGASGLADAAAMSPSPPDGTAVEPGPVGTASLVLGGAIHVPEAGTGTKSSGDGSTDGGSAPHDSPGGDEGSAGERKTIPEVTIKGYRELAEVEKIIDAEQVPSDKLSDQNGPNDASHVAKVVKVINAYLAATADGGGSRTDHLRRAGTLLTQDRNLDAKHSESLILRDAQRFFYGAVGPNIFSDPKTYGRMEPVSEEAGKDIASRDPLLKDGHHRTVAGSAVSHYAPRVYEALKTIAIGLGLEGKVRANDELPASAIGGLPWHSYGEKYASPYNGNNIEAKGAAPPATAGGYRESEKIDWELDSAAAEAIGTADW